MTDLEEIKDGAIEEVTPVAEEELTAIEKANDETCPSFRENETTNEIDSKVVVGVVLGAATVLATVCIVARILRKKNKRVE